MARRLAELDLKHRVSGADPFPVAYAAAPVSLASRGARPLATPAEHRPNRQRDRYGDRWAPVLLAWTTPQQDARREGDTAGIAGTAGTAGIVPHGTGMSGTCVTSPASSSWTLPSSAPCCRRWPVGSVPARSSCTSSATSSAWRTWTTRWS